MNLQKYKAYKLELRFKQVRNSFLSGVTIIITGLVVAAIYIILIYTLT